MKLITCGAREDWKQETETLSINKALNESGLDQAYNPKLNAVSTNWKEYLNLY